MNRKWIAAFMAGFATRAIHSIYLHARSERLVADMQSAMQSAIWEAAADATDKMEGT